MIQFRELKSGKDLAYLMHRQIKFGEWAGDPLHSSKHMVNHNVLNMSYWTLYDLDIKIALAFAVYVKYQAVRKAFFGKTD